LLKPCLRILPVECCVADDEVAHSILGHIGAERNYFPHDVVGEHSGEVLGDEKTSIASFLVVRIQASNSYSDENFAFAWFWNCSVGGATEWLGYLGAEES